MKIGLISELGIYLDSQTNTKQSLKALIQEQFVDDIIPSTLQLVITVAPNATVTLHDDILSFDDLKNADVINHTIEFEVQENSSLLYSMKVAPHDASFISSEIESQAVVTKQLSIRLTGRNSRADVTCACFGINQNVFSFKTLQDHLVQDTTSNVSIKGVLDNSSKLMCNSMIKIHKGAQRSVAEQSNKNIILGTSARAISNPQLEIEANDVKCKHGAAVSKLNKDQFFYLQSRGLDAIKTRQMLVDAFLN